MFFFYSICDKIINKTVKDKKMYNVLIADDNLQIVSILKEYCKKNNFNVTLAHDGEETLEKIRNNKFEMRNSSERGCFKILQKFKNI